LFRLTPAPKKSLRRSKPWPAAAEENSIAMSASAIARSGFDMVFLLSDTPSKWRMVDEALSAQFLFSGIIVDFRTDGPPHDHSGSGNHSRDRLTRPHRSIAGVRRLGERRAALFICDDAGEVAQGDRKSTRLNSSHLGISYAVFCLQ